MKRVGAAVAVWSVLATLVGGTSASAAPPGRLRVLSSPALPTQILIDGQIADSWGLNWLKLAPGAHQVCFTHVEGWTDPPCQGADVTAGATTTVTGTFIQRGELRVITSPAVHSQITLDGNPTNDWGMWTDVPTGSHHVCFGAVADFDPPACQDVTVNAGALTTTTGTFRSHPGALGQSGMGTLTVVTSPAVPSQIAIMPYLAPSHIADSWAVNGLELPPNQCCGGPYYITFGHVPGYTEPAGQAFPIMAGKTTTVTGTFTQRGFLHVLTSPPVPATISVDGIPRDDWGMWTDIPTGSHTVCFGQAPAYANTPPCQTVTISAGAGATTTVTGNYIWSTTESMSTTRVFQTATRLLNGKVLVAGGDSDTSPYQLASAELYDPATATWSTTGSMAVARRYHTATLLSNGKVLVAGGAGPGASDNYLASAELYDPATGTWSPTGSMAVPRSEHSATRLLDGKVLVTGGQNNIGGSQQPQASAGLYDPATGTWSTTADMAAARYGHTATLLSNGKVLVAGGAGPGAELYDPATGTWSPTASMASARFRAAATQLTTGKTLVVGGTGPSFNVLTSAELYDPASGSWSTTASMAVAREAYTATLLLNGNVLVAGGDGNTTCCLASAEMYDPASGTWSTKASMTSGRYWHTATLLLNGNVLVAGGLGCCNPYSPPHLSAQKALSSAELYPGT